MRKGAITTLATVMILTLGMYGCGGTGRGEAGDDGAAEPPEPQLPEVTVEQAEQALSDAMLVSALSLFLVFRAEEGATSVANEEGTLTLAWDETADFNSGVGLYTITMTDYAIPEDDPFGADYNGYVFSGTVETGSTDGIAATMVMDLTTSHVDAENFPVQTLQLEMKSADSGTDPGADGSVHVNGYEMRIEDLAQAFDAES